MFEKDSWNFKNFTQDFLESISEHFLKYFSKMSEQLMLTLDNVINVWDSPDNIAWDRRP